MPFHPRFRYGVKGDYVRPMLWTALASTYSQERANIGKPSVAPLPPDPARALTSVLTDPAERATLTTPPPPQPYAPETDGAPRRYPRIWMNIVALVTALMWLSVVASTAGSYAL
jgi:hypothetical protein